MKTIVVANQKGGSGKSTVTVHLAAAAERADDGQALVEDCDRQDANDPRAAPRFCDGRVTGRTRGR